MVGSYRFLIVLRKIVVGKKGLGTRYLPSESANTQAEKVPEL